MKIPIENFTYVTLVSEDNVDPDNHDDHDDHDDLDDHDDHDDHDIQKKHDDYDEGRRGGQLANVDILGLVHHSHINF